MSCYRRFPKMTVVSHHATHLIASMSLRYGPCQDSPDFLPVVTDAVKVLPIDRLYGDGAYDVEAHHRVSQQTLGIRSTIIPINPRRSHQYEPKGPYRRRLYKRFPKRLYRRRWHAESTFSQHKRRLGQALTARTDHTRLAECLMRVLVHNLMILYAQKGFLQSTHRAVAHARSRRTSHFPDGSIDDALRHVRAGLDADEVEEVILRHARDHQGVGPADRLFV